MTNDLKAHSSHQLLFSWSLVIKCTDGRLPGILPALFAALLGAGETLKKKALGTNRQDGQNLPYFNYPVSYAAINEVNE